MRLLQAMVPDQSHHCLNRGGVGIGSDSCSGWHLALMDLSNFAAEWCQHRNNTVAVPGFSCPNPITRPFDTETDSDRDPDLDSLWTFLDGLSIADQCPRIAINSS